VQAFWNFSFFLDFFLALPTTIDTDVSPTPSSNRPNSSSLRRENLLWLDIILNDAMAEDEEFF